MIIVQDGCFALQTPHTSYIFRKDAAGNLLHLYYGEKIEIEKDGLANVCEIMTPAITNQNGCSLIADTAQPNLCLDDVCLEISSRGKAIRESLMSNWYWLMAAAPVIFVMKITE